MHAATTVVHVRVLVTNDDGVEAPGLRALATAIHSAGYEVIVVAPSGEWSGSGGAIGRLHRAGPIPWTEVGWAELPDVAVHAVDLPPAGAVYAGCLGAFGPRPAVVASGVNPGLNYGHLVLHSGTVGAALTASTLGLPAVAASLGWGEDQEWVTAATLAASAVGWLATRGDATVLNLNVPNIPFSDVKGVRETRLCEFNEQWKATTRPGELLLDYDGHAREPSSDTDLAAVHAGWAAVTLLTGIAGRAGGADAAAAIAGALESGAAA
jgi:5'-nucleotidase